MTEPDPFAKLRPMNDYQQIHIYLLRASHARQPLIYLGSTKLPTNMLEVYAYIEENFLARASNSGNVFVATCALNGEVLGSYKATDRTALALERL